MKSKYVVAFTVAVGLLLASLPSLAHHSFAAEFNAEKLETFTGTLTQIDWINPHVQLYLDQKDTSGRVTKWKVESGPTVHFRTAGLNRNMFAIGQTFTIETFMAKDGTKNFGFLRSVKFVGGPNDGLRVILGAGGGLDQNGNQVQ
jgi:hypothetical protein